MGHIVANQHTSSIKEFCKSAHASCVNEVTQNAERKLVFSFWCLSHVQIFTKVDSLPTRDQNISYFSWRLVSDFRTQKLVPQEILSCFLFSSFMPHRQRIRIYQRLLTTNRTLPCYFLQQISPSSVSPPARRDSSGSSAERNVTCA